MSIVDALNVKDLQSRIVALEEEVATLREQWERLEVRAAIRQGLDEADRGLGTPAKEWARKTRAKHKLPTP